MKTAITAQQLVYYRQNGHIRFDHFPSNFSSIQTWISKNPERRDIWRKHPAIKKWIIQTIAPIALELTGKTSLKLACDQWISEPSSEGRMKDKFCFQGLAIIFLLSAPDLLDIYEPSSLASFLTQDSYLVAFGLDNTRFIENKKDPGEIALKKMGYAYGDVLSTEFHPAIFRR